MRCSGEEGHRKRIVTMEYHVRILDRVSNHLRRVPDCRLAYLAIVLKKP